MAKKPLHPRVYKAHRHARAGKKTPEYRAWCRLKDRCFNRGCKSFVKYGGAGISMARAWRNNFPAFLAHIGERPTPTHSVDRIENSKGYEPGNVRWATPLEQTLNRTNTRWLEFRGERMCLSHWAARYGLRPSSVARRLNNGWSLEEALLGRA